MRTLVLVSALALCDPAVSAAQSLPASSAQSSSGERPEETRATADAVEAIVRADYSKAATLLKPLVDHWTGGVGGTGAFFLAALYENGLGLPQDLPRACALYLRVEAEGGPFARLAGPLARVHMEQLGPERQSECVMLANVGVNHRFAPARFSLDAERWVAVELSSKNQEVVATISEGDEEKAYPLHAALGSGSIFLPIEHTALESPRGSGTLRHFIEVAAWLPLEGSRWQLTWSLSEIADKDVALVAEETLSTIAGSSPPSDVSVPIRDLVALEVNDAGAVEFAILNGADARRERVPAVAERREAQEEARKRRAADEKVNWKRRRDAARAPSFTYTDARACGDVLLSGWSAERSESIAVRADRRFLEEQTTAQRTFDMAALPPEIDVVVNVFDRPQRDWSACSDVTVMGEGQRHESWRAVGGTLRIQLPQSENQAAGPAHYRATIQIEDAEFTGTGGATSRPVQRIQISAVASAAPVP